MCEGVGRCMGHVCGVTNLAFLALFLKASNGGSKRLHISHHNLVLLQKSLQQRAKWKITRRRVEMSGQCGVSCQEEGKR